MGARTSLCALIRAKWKMEQTGTAWRWAPSNGRAVLTSYKAKMGAVAGATRKEAAKVAHSVHENIAEHDAAC
eukprot:791940-Pelagomonas_calceolata.AAC.2